MNKKVWLVLLVTLIIVGGLAACTRSGSKSPAATSTVNKAFPTPVPGSVLENVRSQTQTAAAVKATPAEASATPEPEVAAATPTVEVVVEAATPTTAAVEATPEPTAVPPAAEPTKAPVPTSANPIPTAVRPTTYALKQGEWPICIARRYDVSMSGLLSTNGLNMNSRPGVGTVLKIPQTGNWDSGSRSLKAHPTTYTVSAGDSIYSIACSFGDVDPEAIIAANNLKSPYTLTAGSVINIP